MHLIFLFPFFIFIELTIYFKWFVAYIIQKCKIAEQIIIHA